MDAEIIVIGAGQAGLSASAHLVRKGLRPGTDFLVIDAGEGPGGAWRDRWDSLTFDAAHGIADLPGFPLGHPDPDEPASRVVKRYYGAVEAELGLGVVRPVEVVSVERIAGSDEATGEPAREETRPEAAAGDRRSGDGSRTGFVVRAADGRRWTARAVISATGTWNSPFVPATPGISGFRGRQLHTRWFRSADELAGGRVLVVGGGASATQFVIELRRHGVETVWSTRSTPRWTRGFREPQWGVDVERHVAARTRAGLPPRSVVAETGLDLGPLTAPWVRSGDLVSRGRLLRLTASGAVLDGPGPDGAGLVPQGEAETLLGNAERALIPTLPGAPAPDAPAAWEVPIDVVLWATGFRAHVGHLRGLGVHEPGGGIRMADDDVAVERVPGLFLVGYGPSASTIGATRAGRKAALAAVRFARGAR